MGEVELFPSYDPKHLLGIMKDHARVYTDEEKEVPEVGFHQDTAGIEADTGVIYLNPVHAWQTKKRQGLTEDEAIRQLLNTLSHEIGHYNWTDLTSKREFGKQYPRHAKLAGAVQNVVEDIYIDHNRLKQFEGLKKPFDEATESRLPMYIERFKERNHIGDKMMDLLTITARGEIECPIEVEDEFLQEFVEFLEEELSKVPDLHEQEERLEVSHKIVSTILDNVEEPDEIELLDELIDQIIEELQEELDEDLRTPSEMKEETEETVAEHAQSMEHAPPGDVEPEEEEKVGEGEGEGAGSSEGSEGDSGATESSSGSSSSSSESSSESSSGDSREESSSGESEEEEEGKSKASDSGADREKLGSEIEREVELGEDWTEEHTGMIKELKGTESLEKSKSRADDLSSKVSAALEQLNFEEEEREFHSTTGSELDVRKAVRQKAGDKSERKLYKRTREEENEKVIGVTLDASGSMAKQNSMTQALAAVGALGKATEALGDCFSANTFWSEGDNGKEVDTTTITEVGDSFSESDLEDVEIHYKDPLDLGMKRLARDMEKVDGRKIMFAVTDGNPTVTEEGERGKDVAERVSREKTEKLRARGFDVIGIAVGRAPDEETMEEIFGDEWFRFDSEDLAEKLLTIYRNKR